MQVLIMAGGTGGHVYPALAVAKEFLSMGHKICWMGTRSGLEARVVPAHNIEINWISITGLRRKGIIGWLVAPVCLLQALIQALKIIRHQKPAVVLGLGGFASGPGGVAAWLLRIPLVIHEQNAAVGMTNKILSRLAVKVLQAFPATFSPSLNAEVTGNPVRKDIAGIKPKTAFQDRLNILIVGGSLGALAINTIVPKALSRFQTTAMFNIWHQTGSGKLDSVKDDYAKYEIAITEDIATSGIFVTEYIEDMAQAYNWADVLICRAGAMTVFEVAAAGRPALFIPYPYAVDDHQTANANYLAEAGGGVLIQQSELNSKILHKLIKSWLDDKNSLKEMARIAHDKYIKNSARLVVNACVGAALT